MRLKIKKLSIILVAGMLSMLIFAGCSSTKPASGSANQEGNKDSNSAGTFETTDIEGTSYTQEVFSDYDLTMVNVFATWCSPCVAELPDLEKLHKEMAAQGVNVVGIVMDAVDENGNQDKEALEKAKELKERSGVTYPILIPNDSIMDGRLNLLDCYPTTYFVDKDGNIVGQAYEGSNSLEGWKEIVESELSDLKGENQ